MGDRLHTDPELASALAAAGIANADGLFALGGHEEASHLVTTVRLDVGGTSGRFHLKRYHYPGWERSRHLIGRGTLYGRAPEVNEFLALAWLREHGIPAVRPVAAASRTRGGRLVTHALLTEHASDAVDLDARLHTPGDPVREDEAVRANVLGRLAGRLRRMHDLGFVHRDAHARNVLVRLVPDVEVLLLDCRRGGKRSWRHGPLFDLATLDSDLVDVVPAAERHRALAQYLGSRNAEGAFARRIAKKREHLLRRAKRRGRTRRRPPDQLST